MVDSGRRLPGLEFLPLCLSHYVTLGKLLSTHLSLGSEDGEVAWLSLCKLQRLNRHCLPYC